MTDLKFENEISYVTARIGIQHPGGESSIGTGFFYQAKFNDGSDRSITFLISNRHVFDDPAGRLMMNLNRKKKDGSVDYGNTITVDQNDFREGYVAHPNSSVDLACVNVSPLTHKNAFWKHLHTDFMKPIDYSKVVPGSDVLFVGYPENRYDVVNNLPLIRKGSIASIPSMDFNGLEQIVIDAQVFQGSSGSPVFVVQEANYALLGVVSQTMIRHSKLQTLQANLPDIGVEQILGLGIIVKQKHVQELIDYATPEIIRRNTTP